MRYIIAIAMLAIGARIAADEAPPTTSIVASQLVGVALGDEQLAKLDGLTDAQRTSLKERTPLFFEALAGRTEGPYFELLERWGGRRFQYRKADSPGAWLPENSEFFIAKWDPKSLAVERVEGYEPDGVTFSPGLPRRLGGARLVGWCGHAFGPGQNQLVSDGAPVVQITILTELEAGYSMYLAVRFVWDPGSQGWVPWMCFQEVPEGKPIPARCF